MIARIPISVTPCNILSAPSNKMSDERKAPVAQAMWVTADWIDM